MSDVPSYFRKRLSWGARFFLSISFAAVVSVASWTIWGSSKIPDREAALPVGAEVVSSLQNQVGLVAKQYGFPAPRLIFEDIDVAAYTSCTDAQGCVIHLGRTLISEHFLSHQEQQAAVVLHEAGHALQAERRDSPSGTATLIAYGACLALVFLFALPSLMSLMSGSAIAVVTLGVIPSMPAVSIGVPGAFIVSMIGLSIAMLALSNAPLVSRLRRAAPPFVAMLIFLWVTGLNARYEKASDLFSACVVGSAEPIIDALEHLSKGTATRVAMHRLLDPAHPTLSDRIEALGRLKDAEMLAHDCKRLSDGAI